ncbi:MAG: T9SS type A sorting domain-containing protein, partial [candidate division Zixibacteria bacterium]|nr:T9SS type A sorting domain-containing protein [candidate division Zixibacteria bacterium]
MKKLLLPSLIVVMMLLSSASAYGDNVFIHPDTIYTSRYADDHDSATFYIINATDTPVDFNNTSYPYNWRSRPHNGTIPPSDSVSVMIIANGLSENGDCISPGIEDHLYILNTSDPIDSVISVVLIDTVLVPDPPTVNIISPVGGEQYVEGDTMHIEMEYSLSACRASWCHLYMHDNETGNYRLIYSIQGSGYLYHDWIIPGTQGQSFSIIAEAMNAFGGWSSDESGLFSIRASTGNVWYVSVNGDDSTGDGWPDNPFRTIQKGIDVAVSGDTIKVLSGTYNEHLDIFKSLVFLSTDGMDSTIVDGQGEIPDSSSSIFTIINAGEVYIEGFTIIGGRGMMSPDSNHVRGGGIYTENSDVEIDSCSISYNNHNYGMPGKTVIGGGGVFIDSTSSFHITNSTVNFNFAYEAFGGFDPLVEGELIGGGGILALCNSVRIESSTVQNNEVYSDYVSVKGGGLHLAGDNNSIIDCRILTNVAYGWDIGSEYSNPILGGGCYLNGEYNSIENCIITDNYAGVSSSYNAQTLQGAGVISFGNYLSIKGCHFENNRCSFDGSLLEDNNNRYSGDMSGGALYIEAENAQVDSNVFYYNSINCFKSALGGVGARATGGGIYWSGTGSFFYNLVYSNTCNAIASGHSASAHSYGGGGYFTGEITINHNTFDDNYISAEAQWEPDDNGSCSSEGGGMFVSGGCFVQNCIITNGQAIANAPEWGTAEIIGAGIRIGNDDSLSYSDIWNNHPNDVNDIILPDFNNNVSEDPLFVCGIPFDYHLTESSPCIDTGDPNSPPDPDGTIADMGANYFHHEVIAIGMEPDNQPVIVVAGESFIYTGILVNFTESSGATDVWIKVHFEDEYITVRYWDDVNMELGVNNYYHVTQYVPQSAAPGDYYYIAYCGEYDTQAMIDSCYFTMTVISGDNNLGGAQSWDAFGWGDETRDDGLQKSKLLGSFPNPFNAQAKISFYLNKPGNASLKIYNIAGQLVKSIKNDYSDAGVHNITWDASSVASGIYFYKLSIGDQIFKKKMI